MARVKYPAKAAYARFLPIKNHLTNMVEFLLQAGERELAEKAVDIKDGLHDFEVEIWQLAEMERRDARAKTTL